MERLMMAFTNMVETGYQAALIVLILLAVRIVFQWIRVPRKYIYLLWLIPFLHLLIPFQIESEFSVMPEEAPAVILEMREEADSFEQYRMDLIPSYETEKYDIAVSNSHAGGQAEEKETVSLEARRLVLPVLSVIWTAGIVALTLYSVVSYIRLCRKLTTAIAENEKENIYLADNIFSPFVLCGRKNAIYLPSGMKQEMKEYVILHEKEHIRRKDPIVKLIGFAICLVHWMNPFAWLAYYFLGKDMELACDEAVIQDKDTSYRQEYAKTLLFMSVGRTALHGVPLAFAEGNPKDRVEKIAAYKRPAFWEAAVGIVCIVVLAIVLLSDPKGTDQQGGTGSADGTNISLPESFVEGEGTCAKAAKVNLKGSTGLGGSKLYYVDEEKIIFGGYYGVFVFSKEKAKIIASVDLEDLGWEGSNEGNETLLSIQASADGKYICFSPASDTFDYIYDWETITIYPVSKDVIGGKELPVFDNIYDEGKGSSFKRNGEKVYFQLVEGQSKMIGDLMYREYILDEESRGVLSDKYRHLFLEGRYKDLQAFEPEDLVPIVKAEMVIQGELRTVTDEKILRWIEDNLTVTESIKGGSGCPFANPLYLTRKDGMVGVIYPATDSCSIFRTENGNYYDYTLGFEDNREFWSCFDGWLEGMYPDIYREEEEYTSSQLVDAEYVDGAWIYRGKSYRYRKEITGRWNNAAKDVTYVIVTNDEDITFEELFPLSGLSSNLEAGLELRDNTALIELRIEE